MIIDKLQAMASQLVAYGGPINGADFGNWFRTKYLRLRLLHHPFALRQLYIRHRIILRYLLAVLRLYTVCSMRYFNWQKSWVAF